MKRVLIANRGEIAARILRACRAAGLEAVAVYSTADRDSPYLAQADRAVCIGPPAASQSYLLADALLAAALGTGCDAVHPGYGFMAENAGFAWRCAEHDLTFVGPSPESIELMGDKIAGRAEAIANGVPVVPGSDAGMDDIVAARREADHIGYPLLLKASAGGGGRGMRVVNGPSELESRLAAAAAEAEAAFSDSRLYMERYFPRVHHVEVQVFGDRHGNHVHLGERDCSAQRRHQKLVEESPSPVLTPALRDEICEAAVRLARGVGYENAGTVEFIYDPAGERCYFIEMNTRIQVEHPVTEMVTGTDLVLEQLRRRGPGAAFVHGADHRAPRPCHRVAHQCGRPRARVPPDSGPPHAVVASIRGSGRAHRHLRAGGPGRDPVLRLDARQAHRERRFPRRGAGSLRRRPRRVRGRGG